MIHKKPKSSTSWEPVEKWYKSIVEDEGHYYHRQTILPGVLKLFGREIDSVLDLACGSGVLANQLPENVRYLGMDISPSFIKAAQQRDTNRLHEYILADITKPIKLKKKDFSHSAIILAAQNLDQPKLAFQNVSQHLKEGGSFVLVINHPYFRIPRQTSWGIDENNKIQYRRVDRYMSELKIPIHAHPSKKDASASTLSFHYPLSSFVSWLSEAGFVIESIEEWCSDKTSTGKNAKMENRSRSEIPLFMAIKAIKIKY